MIGTITSRGSVLRPAAGPTMQQVKELQNHIGEILVGSDSWNDLYHSQYTLNGAGITKVGSSYALDLMSETKGGRDAAIQKLLAQPGAKPLPDAQPIGGLRKGDAVLSLPYKGTAIPVVVSYVGLIQAQ
ncbi:MAG: hypothetical protein ACYCW6_13850 [Candidatus Xenobia bacterium]